MKENKDLWVIFLRFVGIWLLLFMGYQQYLNQFPQQVDGVTKEVALQVHYFLKKTGFESTVKIFSPQKTIQFYLSGKIATRMIEGCNAISIMILFVSFVFAFYRGKKTFVFILFGLFVLYLLNILRIYCLNVIVAKLPELTHPAHDYFFPAIIYGGVLFLWLIWIHKWALKK